MLNQLSGQYEIVVPTLVDNKGDFLSFDVTQTPHRRKRRSTNTDNDAHFHARDSLIYYSLSAYGMDFHFNLTLNRVLLAPKYVAEFWDRHGILYSYKGKNTRHCHYVGHIRNSRFSRVALSNCFGLVSRLLHFLSLILVLYAL